MPLYLIHPFDPDYHGRLSTTGHIALNSLLRLASVLGDLDEFGALFPEKPPVPA